MVASVEDFLGGALRECRELAATWQDRRPPGLDRRLARLSGWTALARTLPPDLDGPNGPEVSLDIADYRRLWGEARALAALAPLSPATAPAVIEQLYGLMASRADPPQAFKDAAARAAVADWTARHVKEAVSLPQAAMAMVDFIAIDPMSSALGAPCPSWGSETIAALLAAALPLAGGEPLLLVLGATDRGEDGYRHALTTALANRSSAAMRDDAAWIAFYLGKARRAWKRLPALAEGTEKLHQRWVRLFTRADFGPEAGEHLAQALLALPAITPSFIADTGLTTDILRDGLVLLFAADDAVEVTLPGQGGLTLLPGPLRLLV